MLREGSDVTVIGYSGSVHQAMRAADMLEKQEEISAEVIDLRTLRPLDMDTVIASVKKTNRAVIVEDDWLFGGFGGELSAQIMERAFDWLDAPVARVSCKDVPLPTIATWSSPRCLRKKMWWKPSSACSRSSSWPSK